MTRAATAGPQWSSQWSSERGDVSPLVIMTPLMVFAMMLVVQMGLFFHARTVLVAAAQDATRVGQLETATEADARQAAESILGGSDGLMTVTDIRVTAGPDVVEVEIAAEVQTLIPFWSGATSASASGPKERFRPENER